MLVWCAIQGENYFLIYSPLPKRVVWLFVLLSLQLRLSGQEDIVALAAFIPLLVGTGGSGSVLDGGDRGMNTDEIRE